jgi:hypothetical protein
MLNMPKSFDDYNGVDNGVDGNLNLTSFNDAILTHNQRLNNSSVMSHHRGFFSHLFLVLKSKPNL